MKFAMLQMFRALLVLGLALYGPLAMAGDRAEGAVFSSEICANGVVEVLYVDADGTPVEPHGGCLDCQVCCHISVSFAGPPCGATLSQVLIDAPDKPGLAHVFLIQKHMTRPMPRGPPVARHSKPTAPDLIGIDQVAIGNPELGRGRSNFKDATA
ncbi:hypothetical protein [Sedimentitalea todarodis]|uniref:DUF2946 domain-containing protein n=1 Tax=Sedimentitalea todarodis TaxID=1631240 RepID=A0ABU3VHF6_9RHOB|nr:hypothetical protein [Sedimentitalea todarodis]MDU9005604.1 hypothetical protein [Sedimentitalea todarodis]